MSDEQAEVIAAVEPTAIADVNTAVAKFDRVAAGITELRTKYQGLVYEVGTTKGMKEACDARAAIRAPRYEVERVRKECKAPILALGKDIDARAAAITADLLALEAPVDEQIKAAEQRKEEERKAKADAERKRVMAIQEDIENDLRCVPAAMTGRSAAEIDQAIRDVAAIEITVERFAEFAQTAAVVKESSLTKLRDLQAKQVAHEVEQQRLRQERDELARLRAAQEAAAKAEREAAQAERQRQADADAAKLRARIEETERAAKAERDRIAAEEAESKRKREAEEAAATIERKRKLDEELAKLRAEHEESERIAKEQREAAQAEHARIAAENARLESERRERVRIEDQERARVAQAERDRLAEEQLKLQAEREQVEVLRASLAKPVAQVSEANEPDAAPVLRTAPSTALVITEYVQPTAEHLIGLVAAEYGVSHDMAAKWLRDAFGAVLV